MRVVFGSVFVILFLLNLAAPYASDISRTDKVASLYSNRLSFDKRGVPRIRIALFEGEKVIELRSKQRIRVFPDGLDSSKILGGNHWRVRLLHGAPAKVDYYLVLGRAPVSQRETLSPLKQKWKNRGVKLETKEIGSVFGFSGQVFDNRSMLLLEGPFSSLDKVKSRGEYYRYKSWITKIDTFTALKRRSKGTLLATDLQTGTTIQVKDVLWFQPNGSRMEIYHDGQWSPYRGQFYVAVDRKGKLTAVNDLPSDQLLAGVVPAEILPSAPEAALDAQTIAARGNLLAKIGNQNLADPYSSCAWVRCQVYRGVSIEHPRTNAAIQRTRGMVLVNKQHGGLVDAVYHAVSGGFTENNELVWPGLPDENLRARLDNKSGNMARFSKGIDDNNIDSWLRLSPNSFWDYRAGINRSKFRWQREISAQKLSRKLRTYKLGKITRLKVLTRGKSGRAIVLGVWGTRSNTRIYGELTIRRLLGGLPSSMISVHRNINRNGEVVSFDVQGGGWGHGVGMSQTGAIGMARGGHSYKAILQHYYLKSALARIF